MKPIRQLNDWFVLIKRWRRRSHERRALAAMDGRALRDIGISRWEARCEVEKPFWRA
jgi:uncharacterized protein YjiS (DUF1127 family)